MAGIVFALIALVLTAGLASAQGLDGRLTAINKTKIIKIAYRTDAAPFSFLNENREPAGYTVDLSTLVVRLLEKQLGVQELDIQWVPSLLRHVSRPSPTAQPIWNVAPALQRSAE